MKAYSTLWGNSMFNIKLLFFFFFISKKFPGLGTHLIRFYFYNYFTKEGHMAFGPNMVGISDLNCSAGHVSVLGHNS